jgi:hypothetical protein
MEKMAVVVLHRFTKKYYGDKSSFSLESFDELQDVECNVIYNADMATVLENELLDLLQDNELVAALIANTNVVHGDYALLEENSRHYTLVWQADFKVVLQGEKADALIIPKFGICLLEFFLR